VKINHVVADMHGTRSSVFGHLEPQTAIEGHHAFRILHGQSHVIEAAHFSSGLRA
jgi:hypothetical protein